MRQKFLMQSFALQLPYIVVCGVLESYLYAPGSVEEC
jgi:hypothetical protein